MRGLSNSAIVTLVVGSCSPFQVNYRAYPVHRNWDLLGQEKTAIRGESFQNNGLEGELKAISRLSMRDAYSENLTPWSPPLVEKYLWDSV